MPRHLCSISLPRGITRHPAKPDLICLKTLITGPYDLHIAAQGMTGQLNVVTHHYSKFGRIHGLNVKDRASLIWLSSGIACLKGQPGDGAGRNREK